MNFSRSCHDPSSSIDLSAPCGDGTANWMATQRSTSSLLSHAGTAAPDMPPTSPRLPRASDLALGTPLSTSPLVRLRVIPTRCPCPGARCHPTPLRARVPATNPQAFAVGGDTRHRTHATFSALPTTPISRLLQNHLPIFRSCHADVTPTQHIAVT